MRDGTPAQFAMRIAIYTVGLFCLSMGVAFSVNSNLGVSPITSVPYVLSKISGNNLSLWVIAANTALVGLQILLLRRRFPPINLFQIIFSVIFGYFTDFTKFLLGDLVIPTYLGQLSMLFISIIFVALGVALYMEVNLVPLAQEGFSSVVSKVGNIPFHRAKIYVDCSWVALAIFLSLIFMQKIEGIREGTLITAFAVGRILPLFRRRLSPVIRWLCFAGKEIHQ